MSRMTAGRAVAAALERAGIRHAFTVPGESFLELLDALRDSPIHVVATRHEAGAGFMAEGYAQLTGIPAACLVTRAVGTSNLSIALHTAMQDSAPLVAIAGQVPRRFRGREAFQEVDLATTFGALCKAAAELDDASMMASAVQRLVRVARVGRPGPVLISLPEDTLEEPVVASARETAAPPPDLAAPDLPDLPERPEPPADAVRDILRMLAAARRPVVVAGGGVRASGAVDDLVAFADAAEVPVIAAWRRTDVFPNASPRYLGSTGLSAAPTVRPRLAEADVILAVGTRLSEIASFGYAIPGPGTSLVQVDVEPGFRGDRPAPAIGMRADARAFLRAARAMLAGVEASALGLLLAAPLAAARARQTRADRAAFEQVTRLPDTGPRAPGDPVHPASVIAALRRHLAEDAIVTTDAGNFAGWAARYLPVPPRGRFIGPTSGAMGYGLPAAIGAALAVRDLERHEAPRQVVALAGDGGIAMLMAEMETAAREALRLAVIVFDNAMYGTIRGHQERAHPGRVVATELGRMDFRAIAQACGARAMRVEHDVEVDAAVATALAGPGVSLVHLLTDPRVLSVDRRLD